MAGIVSDANVEASLRRDILAAAVAELRTWGFERFSFEAVADRAELPPEVVRDLWSSTEKLVVDALVQLCGLTVRVPDTGSLKNDLVGLLTAFADYFNTDIGRSLLRTAVIGPDQCAPTGVRAHLWRTSGKALRVIFKRAERRNEIRQGIDHNIALQIATGPLFQRALYSNDPIDTAFCAHIADLVWHAVRRQDAPPAATG
jgi:hypothetical protein